MDTTPKVRKPDAEIIAIVTGYIAAHPYATRNELRRVSGASQQRLEKLAQEGHFIYPAAMNKSVAATMRRKKYNVMKGWYINKPMETRV